MNSSYGKSTSIKKRKEPVICFSCIQNSWIQSNLSRRKSTFQEEALNSTSFGPGFYTTPSLNNALEYNHRDGVISVFEDVNWQASVMKDSGGQDWQVTVDFWTGATVSNALGRVPVIWNRSDILDGPISSTDMRSGRRVAGQDSQVVGVSYARLETFASALNMII